MTEVFHFQTCDGNELKVRPENVKTIEYSEYHAAPAVILHLITTGQEFPIFANDANLRLVADLAHCRRVIDEKNQKGAGL